MQCNVCGSMLRGSISRTKTSYQGPGSRGSTQAKYESPSTDKNRGLVIALVILLVLSPIILAAALFAFNSGYQIFDDGTPTGGFASATRTDYATVRLDLDQTYPRTALTDCRFLLGLNDLSDELPITGAAGTVLSFFVDERYVLVEPFDLGNDGYLDEGDFFEVRTPGVQFGDRFTYGLVFIPTGGIIAEAAYNF